jgi:hypothetical protein
MVHALVISAGLLPALQAYPGLVALCHGYTWQIARTGPLGQVCPVLGPSPSEACDLIERQAPIA